MFTPRIDSITDLLSSLTSPVLEVWVTMKYWLAEGFLPFAPRNMVAAEAITATNRIIKNTLISKYLPLLLFCFGIVQVLLIHNIVMSLIKTKRLND
jgi:hypothetical protein